MTVRAILSRKGRNVITIEPTATLQAAIAALAEHGIGAVVVLGRIGARSAFSRNAMSCAHLRKYIPRMDVDMTMLARTDHATNCPYKGDCAYYSIPQGGVRPTNAVWTYESPYAAVAAIRDYLAFYPDRVDAIEERPGG